MSETPKSSMSNNAIFTEDEQNKIQSALQQVAKTEQDSGEGKCLVEIALVELAQNTIENSDEPDKTS